MSTELASGPVHGRVDRDGRLIEADPQLLGLQLRAGGEAGGAIAVPQIAALARLANRLGILVSRAVIAADGEVDVDLWVRAQPEQGEVRLTIAGWTPRPVPAAAAPDVDRDTDFLRASADWLWEADESLTVVALSAAAEEAIGGPASDMIGQPLTRLFRLIENDEGQLPLLEALGKQARFQDQEAELRDGNARVRLSAVPLIDGGGRFTGFRGSAAWTGQTAAAHAPDLPVDDAFGERLERALRGPLGRIIERAEAIAAQGEGPLRRDYADYAGDIASAGRHLLALVDDLVDLQAIERPDFAVEEDAIDLADLAQRAAGLFAVRAADRDIRIERDIPASLLARGEFRRVLQILVNLIGNALRYSPPSSAVTLRAVQKDGRVALIIADEGKGIAPEDQARIFDKFERVDTSEPGGSGLGLYIARRLARAMGGDLTIESAPGQGARFALSLPAA